MNHPVFEIEGNGGARTLAGTLSVRGAKNAALKILSAAPLFADGFEAKGVPAISDIDGICGILRGLGVSVTDHGAGRYDLRVPKDITTTIEPEISKSLRASIVLTGPVLARTGEVVFPHPGGCVIGERPIDIFLTSFRRMGATVAQEGEQYRITAPEGLVGAEIFFPVPSVTATETIMMAATLASGVTRIIGAATEPEIVHLAKWLNTCGAHIEGVGTPQITITGTGGTLLSGVGQPVLVPPDRIEAGSFLILAALAGRDLAVSGVPTSEMTALFSVFEKIGVSFSIDGDTVFVTSGPTNTLEGRMFLKTLSYPGFPTDLQAPLVVLLTQTAGETLVFETIFEGRLNYTEELVRMGADIVLMDPHRALVRGITPLRGREMESPDLRAGLAYLFAGVIAEGRSLLHNVGYIDRGYESIEERLAAVGVPIVRRSV